MSADRVRRVLREHLPGRAGARLVPLGHGQDHGAWLADGDLVVRIASDADPVRRADSTRAEAALLAVLRHRTALAVPAPVLVVPEEGCLVWPFIPGVPALALERGERGRVALRAAPLLAAFLTGLHRTAPCDVPGLPVDDTHPEEYRVEAAGLCASLGPALTPALRPAVEAFVAEPAPRPAARPAVCHADLGAEHLLVDPAADVVTAVIDWGDAAVTDPARDLARLLRDLGPRVLDAVLAGYAGPEPCGPGFRERVLFFARCAALEDLAYGLATGRESYVRNAGEAITLLFGGPRADH